jgi:Icc protein
MTIRRLTIPVPNPIDATGIVSWAHFGDLHMTSRHEVNYRDFAAIVQEVNCAMTTSLNFAYLPGDVAEHGTLEEYEVVREIIDELKLPWFAIVGDHDVVQQTHTNFLQSIMPRTFYAFDVGVCRFFALDAFASGDPKQFDLSPFQLKWLTGELSLAEQSSKQRILLLHCYPSELTQSSDPLRKLIRNSNVLLVDMGHTHYNEIANDGLTLYTATRSTGQIEEGEAGFSVTNIDNGVVSWRFKPLGKWPLAMITFPGDERLRVGDQGTNSEEFEKLPVHVKAWSDRELIGGSVTLGERTVMLSHAHDAVWTAELPVKQLQTGLYDLHVAVVDAVGKIAEDSLRVAIGTVLEKKPTDESRLEREQVVGPWLERGILGTQLGPNKNGRKW